MATFIKKLRNLTFAKIIHKFTSIFYEKRIYLYYKFCCDKPGVEFADDPDINVQKLSDLSLYSGSMPWLTREELIKQAEERYAKGAVLYTIVIDDVLAHYGWLIKGGQSHHFTEVDMIFVSPPDSIHLYDFYTEPQFRRQGLYLKNIKKMMHDGIENHEAKIVYIGASHTNSASRAAIEKMGFMVSRKYVFSRIGWKITKNEYLFSPDALDDCPQ